MGRSVFFELKPISLASGLLLAVILAGCGKGTPDEVATAPQLNFECRSVQSAGCRDDYEGRTVFFGLTENTATNCRIQLSFYSGDQLTLVFNYSSQTTAAAKVSALVGNVAHWVNSYAMPVTLLDDKSYKICAFIDLNNNGTLNANEPYADMFYTNGSKNVTVSDWTTF